MLGNINVTQKEAIAALQTAIAGGDEKEAAQAWAQFHQSIVDAIKEDYATYNGDTQVLIGRGYRQLTSDEIRFYNGMIEAGKSQNPKQAWTELITTDEDFMPKTIIEDVFRDLVEAHPLLAKINFQNVSYLTKWLLNDHSGQNAVWGPINSAITKKIESSFREMDLTLCKLSAYVLIEEDMLDLGPAYLDSYIRAILRESVAIALEAGIVTGTGNNQPIGLDRDISHGVTVTAGVYPKKTAIEVKSFEPAEYGALLAQLSVTEVWYTDDNNDDAIAVASTAANKDGSAKDGYTKHGGKPRAFSGVGLLCNQKDYLTKVMPATTVLNAQGAYVNNLFPFPTDVVRSGAVPEGEAILFLPEQYFMGIGSSKEGSIEYSDEYKFLEDQRVYKIKLHGNGRAYDNTCALRLDISKLKPGYINVRNVSDETGATGTTGA